MSESIAKSVPMLQKCLKRMDAVGIGANVEQFEKVFEDLDVKTDELTGAMDNIYATSIDEGEVANLLNEMKDQNAMEIGGGMQGAASGNLAPGQQNANDLQSKLDQLKNL